MSRSNDSFLRIGCPSCDARVDATVPPGPGIVGSEADEPNPLRGKDAHCDSCGHELELFFY
ncbi:hypothetical protein [Halovivax sp.]|uniref:hypothetical protein n=1 Tax=Halovivax sp. TaxID=1935978 RepID=UPI0025BD6C73|nr:hypothetical protein [Halovivax sp.]